MVYLRLHIPLVPMTTVEREAWPMHILQKIPRAALYFFDEP
jgi:hypothetical protein